MGYKMTFLLFDTETSGLYNYDLPSNHKDQPYLLQIAYQVITDDPWVIQKETNKIIYYENICIPEETQNVHGINPEICKNKGIDPKIVLQELIDDVNNFNVNMLVAHNIRFDYEVLKSALIRNEMSLDSIKDTELFCTSDGFKNVTKLLMGNGKYKRPSLQELHYHLFHDTFDDGHDAMQDVRITSKCLKKILER